MILVLGDVILDSYIIGNVERISPEAPVPVVLQRGSIDELGGAANVAKIININNIDTMLMACVYEDTAGFKIVELCKNQKIENKIYMDLDIDKQTPHKIRVAAGNQQICRIDNETSLPDVTKYLYDDISLFSGCTICVISDYAKGTVRSSLEIIKEMVLRDIRVIVDPKQKDIFNYDGAYIVKPNLKEFLKFLETAGIKVNSESIESLGQAAVELISKTSIKNLVVTLAERGCLLISSNGDVVRFAGVEVEVSDVTGAGDAFTAILAIAVQHNLSIKSAVRLAHRAGIAAVKKFGTAPVYLRELINLQDSKLQENSNTIQEDFFNKIIRKDEKVVFTNGCFDILHIGHIHLLENARKLGHKLIVGINSDSSVKKLKGKGRPINNLSARMKMLQAINFVDLVLPFDEETPINLIKTIKPDLLVKGSDYIVENIIGAEEVLSWGGEVITIDMIDDYSTSALISKIQD
jgi:D-beta-D-heptose 7-phosphate kinase / D-beta-D-heptose 1-phosphate adenosyltransferase